MTAYLWLVAVWETWQAPIAVALIGWMFWGFEWACDWLELRYRPWRWKP